jgi:hypothetical protein
VTEQYQQRIITPTITLAALAAGATRQSVKIDLGPKIPDIITFELQVDFSVAPVLDEEVTAYWAGSLDNTLFVGREGLVTGTDALYTGLRDRGIITVGALKVEAAITSFVAQFEFSPRTRYGSILVHNGCTPALNAVATQNRARLGYHVRV